MLRTILEKKKYFTCIKHVLNTFWILYVFDFKLLLGFILMNLFLSGFTQTKTGAKNAPALLGRKN